METETASAGRFRGAGKACDRAGNHGCREKIFHVFSLPKSRVTSAAHHVSGGAIRDFCNTPKHFASLVRRPECGMNATSKRRRGQP
jgi:hypothetical protein